MESDVSNVSCGNLVFNDPFEGIFYRTHISESKLDVNLYRIYSLIHSEKKPISDYMSSVDVDETSFVSRCTTHIKGAKCSLKLDSHFKSVELSGIGFKLWRKERFPQIAQSLFKRLMQELNSRIEDSSQGELFTEETTDITDTRQKCAINKKSKIIRDSNNKQRK